MGGGLACARALSRSGQRDGFFFFFPAFGPREAPFPSTQGSDGRLVPGRLVEEGPGKRRGEPRFDEALRMAPKRHFRRPRAESLNLRGTILDNPTLLGPHLLVAVVAPATQA